MLSSSASLLAWIVAIMLGLSDSFLFNGNKREKQHAARALLQVPIGISPLSLPAAETCPEGTLTQTSTATTMVTITPTPETTTTTVTATAPTATDTSTETTTELMSSALISTSTASRPVITQTTAVTCLPSPGATTTTSEVCITKITTQTVTSSTTLTATTATATDTTTVTPSTSTTTISTQTISVITTSTITITPAPTTTSVGSVSPTGLKYYNYYPRVYKSGSNFFANVPTIVDGVRNNSQYNLTGSIRNINALTSSNNQILFPDGQNGPGSSFALVFQGYLYPALGAGTYKISSREGYIDDVALVWTGEKALGNNWSYTNYDYGAEWPTTGRTLPTSGSVSFTLAANEVKALTIFWGNTDGPGTADFVIGFGGTNYTDTSQFFVGSCNSDTFRP